jgi:two-component system cell cycle sensor histidine kinase/response regulator CckA
MTESSDPLSALAELLRRSRESGRLPLDIAQSLEAELDVARRRLEVAPVLGYLSADVRELLEAIPERVVLLGEDLSVLWSRGTTPSGAAACGRSCGEICRCSAVGEGTCPAKRALETGEVATYEYVDSDGRIWFSHAAPLRGDARTGARVLLLMRDVTDERNLDRQLRQAQKMEALGRLAGGVAHDFNNLLTAIAGNSTLLQARVATDTEALGLVEEVSAAARRGANLTRRLLVFSRRHVDERKFVDVNALIEGIRALLDRIIGEDIQLTTALAPGLPICSLDPGEFEQALVNLAVNARDAMPRGGKLTIRTRVEPTTASAIPGELPPNLVAIDVADTGSGMDDETMAHAFEPFFTTKPAGTGTGLGLPMVYAALTRVGGSVLVNSRVGRGTTVVLRMPAASSRQVADEKPQPATAPATGTEVVMVVEDEAAVRRVTRRLLSRLGYQVLEAGSGGEALELLRNPDLAVDLLLTDVVMPGLMGTELAAQSRRMRADLRILFMSGHTESEALQQSLSARSATLLRKPFTPEALAAAVRLALDTAPLIGSQPPRS